MGRILVVDDDVDILKVVDAVLESAGHVVTTSSNGAEGLQQYQLAKRRTNPFDMILLDLAMPYLNGYEIASRIRDSGDHDVKIAFFTGADIDDDLCKRAEQLQSCGLWMKPMSVDEIKNKVYDCLVKKDK